MMKAADARHRDYRARRRRSPLNRAEGRRLLVKSDVRAVLIVQVINTIPILLKSEKSCIRGIRGAVAK